MQGPTVIPTPPKPPCLYRVTDSTSHTLPNHLSGDFDTGTQTGATWEDIISPLTLDRQLDGPDFHFHNVSEDDDNNDYESHLAKIFNSPLFVSTTTSAAWATSEHRRRLLKKRRRDVRTYKIDLHRFEWEYVELGKGIKFPILRSPGWECAVFSTDCATQGLNWWNHKRDSLEWFAVVCIPSKFIHLVEVNGVLLSSGSSSDTGNNVSWAG
ncbi:uncharacterized protein SEPMUDRAFT_120159 [Sphaerulina musiva SO2202]|uniref:Uncharacterized protein n=1 Tax=Sphaerulina musiva (strain SO2202) TaxID=692275 RepID=N1QH09_SPHMS|nr:uncharacterized protein SEPMUDRAFT_120159 [Sphaerulina musiva SO2202]EMF09299.1 hypothetical protein SEPMUDRAFT_120159 [Sphaerulina musiva SO2202]